MTTLHKIAASLNIDVGAAARIIITGKAPTVWGRNANRSQRVKSLLAAVTPRLKAQAEFINRRQFAL